MKCVMIYHAQTGMVLAKDAVNPQGTLLLKEGHRLTDRNLRVLKSWGVPKIWIEEEGHSGGEPAGLSPTASELQREAELAEKFDGLLDHPVMAEIFKIALRHQREQSFEADDVEEQRS